MSNYKELKVWKTSIKLSVKVYEVLKSFPDDEKFGLTSQMKRSVISISSNIAEGSGRNNPKEFIHFLGIANGSCAELDSQLHVAFYLNFIDKETFDTLVAYTLDISKMIYGLKKSIYNNVSQN